MTERLSRNVSICHTGYIGANMTGCTNTTYCRRMTPATIRRNTSCRQPTWRRWPSLTRTHACGYKDSWRNGTTFGKSNNPQIAKMYDANTDITAKWVSHVQSSFSKVKPKAMLRPARLYSLGDEPVCRCCCFCMCQLQIVSSLSRAFFNRQN